MAKVDYYNAVLGQFGCRTLTGAATADEKFVAIHFLADGTLTATSLVGGDNEDGLTTYTAGTIIYGQWNTVVSSAKIRAYKAEPSRTVS